MSDTTSNRDIPNLDTLPVCIDVELPTHLQGGSLAAALALALWQGNQVVVTVGFLDGDPAWHATVKRHAVTWCDHAAVQWRFADELRLDPRQANIRITFKQPGNWSFIGRNLLQIPTPLPTMNLGSLRDASLAQYHRGVVLHEFGHALGLVHEHQNPAYTWTDDQGGEHTGIPWDEEAVYAYYKKTQGWTREKTRQQVIDYYSRERLVYDTFDPQSVMLYPVDPSLTRGRFQSGWNGELSEADKAFIAELYSKPA